MGWLKRAINSVTDLAGIRLFSGGTLSDQGARKARDAAEASVGSAQEQYASLGALANALLGGDNPWSTVLNERMGQAGQYAAGDMSGSAASQYGLNPVQQKLLNQQQGIVNSQQKKAMQAAQLSLQKRGITSGPMYDAVMGRLQQTYGQQLQTLNAQYLETARNQRIAENNAFIQQLLGQIGQGAGLKQSAAAGTLGIAGAQQAQAAEAQARSDAGQQRTLAAITAAFGPNLGNLFKPGTAAATGNVGGSLSNGVQPFVPVAGGVQSSVSPIPNYQMGLNTGGLLGTTANNPYTLKLGG